MTSREAKTVDLFIQYGVAAGLMAVADSGLEIKGEFAERVGCFVGAGLGGVSTIEATCKTLAQKGPRHGISPFFVPMIIVNLTPGQISIRVGAKGPNMSQVSACSTGAHAIGDAARLIALDDADVMLAGGAESAICRIGMAGFVACRALSTGFNDTPEKASRPYDKDRDGFVMGAGAGVVMLEEYEHAKARGAKIYAEVKGYGLSGDAHHITAPAEDGNGGFRSMRMALNRAGMEPADIDYINAHGTSTPLGDEIELRAVERLFGNSAGKVAMSSTKSSIGHLLGAAGAVEAIFCALAMRDQVAPPTLNLDNPSVATQIDLVPYTPRKMPISAALSNSFGFGGTNASLVLTAAA
jgi:3-oxoacyl-[acyl-carrier-protein] synthase II